MKYTKKIAVIALSLLITAATLFLLPNNSVSATKTKVKTNQDHELELAVETFDAINAYRKNLGLPLYKWSNELFGVATVRVKEITGKFSHTRPNGLSFESAYSDSKVNYLYVGENLGYGFKSGSDVLKGWLTSGLHRELIESTAYKYCAIGVKINSDGTIYYTAEFMNN